MGAPPCERPTHFFGLARIGWSHLDAQPFQLGRDFGQVCRLHYDAKMVHVTRLEAGTRHTIEFEQVYNGVTIDSDGRERNIARFELIEALCW